MTIVGRRTKMCRGESVILHFDVYLDEDKQTYYTIPDILNPHIVVNVKSNCYRSDDFYSLNIWLPMTASDDASFDVSLPTWITRNWVEQQYLLSINVVGGTNTIVTLQGIFRSLYGDNWRYVSDEIPDDYNTLYRMIEYKNPKLLTGIVNRPISHITYDESLTYNRTVLIG